MIYSFMRDIHDVNLVSLEKEIVTLSYSAIEVLRSLIVECESVTVGLPLVFDLPHYQFMFIS